YFLGLIKQLARKRASEENCEPFPSATLLATPIGRNEIAKLGLWLEEVFTDAARFGQLTSLYFSDPDFPIASPRPLPADLRMRFLVSGTSKLLQDEIILIATSPDWVAELWDALDEPTDYWYAVQANVR